MAAASSETTAQVFVKVRTNINITRVPYSSFTGENLKGHYLGTLITAVLHRLAHGECTFEVCKFTSDGLNLENVEEVQGNHDQLMGI